MRMKVEKATSLGATPKAPINYVRKPVTRSTSAKQPKALVTLQHKGKCMLQETQILLLETQAVLLET